MPTRACGWSRGYTPGVFARMQCKAPTPPQRSVASIGGLCEVIVRVIARSDTRSHWSCSPARCV
ncbi:hypothetical protein BHL63_01700 [Xanthomonas alfalfae]|nr:hypothetical protein BHL63_01700 [Xanthomonas alfalfae]